MCRYPHPIGLYIAILWGLCAVCGALPAKAQLRYAFGAGYDYTDARMLNKAIQYFNFTHPATQHKPLTHGFYGTAELSSQTLPHLYVHLRASYHQAGAKMNNLVNEFQTQMRGYALTAGMDYYLSKGISNFSGAYTHGLYISAAAGAGLIQHRFLQQNQPVLYNQKPYENQNTPFCFETGIGYDIHTKEYLSLTPEIRLMYYPNYTLDHVYEAYYGSPLPTEDSPKRGLLFLQMGLLFRFHTQSSRY